MPVALFAAIVRGVKANYLWMGLFALICLVAIGFMADCGLGSRRYTRSVVQAHHYVAERMSVTTDSEGHITTTTYPEEFHLICLGNDGSEFDVNTRRITYFLYTNGEPVIVLSRCGRWTKADWVPKIIKLER